MEKEESPPRIPGLLFMLMCVHTQTGPVLLLLVFKDYRGKDHNEEKNKFLCTCKRGWRSYLPLMFSDSENLQHALQGKQEGRYWLSGTEITAGSQSRIHCWGGCCWKLAEPGSIPSLWNADPPMSEMSNLSSKRRMIPGFLMVSDSTQTMFIPASPRQSVSGVRPLTQSTKTSLLV